MLHPLAVAPALAVLGLLVSSAYVGYRLPPSDEGAILTQAAKILRGGVFYRDIDAYPFPAAAYLLAGAMGLFGEHVAVARWLAVGIYCGILLTLYAIAAQLLERRRAALLGISFLGFKFVAWPGLTAYCYWDLAFLFACLAIALLLRPLEGGDSRGVPRLIAAGLCTGLSLASKQSLGIYLTAAVSLLLLLPPRPFGSGRRSGRIRELAAFGAGASAPLLLMLAYFAAQGVLSEMLASGLVRPLSSYLPTSGLSGLVPLRWWELGELQHPRNFRTGRTRTGGCSSSGSCQGSPGIPSTGWPERSPSGLSTPRSSSHSWPRSCIGSGPSETALRPGIAGSMRSLRWPPPSCSPPLPVSISRT